MVNGTFNLFDCWTPHLVERSLCTFSRALDFSLRSILSILGLGVINAGVFGLRWPSSGVFVEEDDVVVHRGF
jgi:hypothetical protein